MDLKNKTILFLGDSITEGHGTTSEEKRFSNIVAKALGANFINDGIGGSRYARQHNFNPEARCDKDFCMRTESREGDLDCIVIFGGTNDYDHGDAPLGEFGDRTPMTFYGALHTVYSTFMQRYPGTPIIVLTPLHRGNEVKGAIGDKPLLAYVNAIREVAEFYSLPVLDLYARSGIQPQVPAIKEKNMPDNLLPNDAGHVLLSNLFINFLKAL